MYARKGRFCYSVYSVFYTISFLWCRLPPVHRSGSSPVSPGPPLHEQRDRGERVNLTRHFLPGRRSFSLVNQAKWTANEILPLVQARFPLQQSYRTELRQLYDHTVELVPLDFTRKTTLPNSQRVLWIEKKLRRVVFQEGAQALNFCPPYATPHQEMGEGVDIWIGG